jgi:CheY-like chemotaxis protein
MMAHQASMKPVSLHVALAPGVGDVCADRRAVQQMLINLVSNAVKFTPKNGRIQVRLERVNSHIEIAVSDTGIGIRPDFIPYVFERFRQADSGSTRKTGGLGLGLAIVRHIVEMHGGTVEASSDGEDKGATFRVRLPLMIVHPAQVPAPRAHPRTERREAMTRLGDLHGIRVMAIDDDEDALHLLRVVLETAGADVTILGSPLAALQRIAEVKPHVLVVDLGMPEIDGFEVIRRVRASVDPAIRNVPAAALTAFARSEDRTKALQSGFQMHLAKPVDPGELVASIATLAKRVSSEF